LIKTQQQNIHEISKLRWRVFERKALASNQIRESSKQGAVRKKRVAEAFELGGQKQEPTNRYTL